MTSWAPMPGNAIVKSHRIGGEFALDSHRGITVRAQRARASRVPLGFDFSLRKAKTSGGVRRSLPSAKGSIVAFCKVAGEKSCGRRCRSGANTTQVLSRGSRRNSGVVMRGAVKHGQPFMQPPATDVPPPRQRTGRTVRGPTSGMTHALHVGGKVTCLVRQGHGRKAQALDGDILTACARVGKLAAGRVIIETPERIQIGTIIGLRAIDLFGRKCVNSCRKARSWSRVDQNEGREVRVISIPLWN